MRRIITAMLTTATATLVAVGAGTITHADRYYHTAHAELHPVTNAPLRRGFVNNIHMEGPNNYAQEYYQLNGAMSDTTYYAVIELHFDDTSCSPGTLIDLPDPPGLEHPGIFSAVIETNAAGNAHAASPRFTPVDVAGLEGFTHGVNWVIYDTAGNRAYETGCNPDYLD